MQDISVRLRHNARHYANKPALMFGGQELTYAELDDEATRIAAALAARGAAPEKVYPILLERSPTYVAALLGVMRAGGAAAPLSTTYPRERVNLIARDCGADFVVDDAFVSDALASDPATYAAPPHAPDSAALVIYTSGSTGTPKGIVHERAELAAAIQRTADGPDGPNTPGARRKDDVHLSITPFSFVAMVADLLIPLWMANTVHILDEHGRRDPAFIADYVTNHGITTTFVCPQLLRQLPNLPKSLRIVDVGGERLSNYAPDRPVVRNAYSMSEVAGAVFARPVDRAYQNTPLGEPLPGIVAHLLDEDGRTVAPGEEGELYLAGPIARGYLNQPELTQQTFLTNPFAAQDGYPYLLRTGDIFRHDEKNGYAYISRRDWMVKVNGQRVELGEVEARLASNPQVDAAVCRAFVDGEGQSFVAAYYTLAQKVVRADETDAMPKTHAVDGTVLRDYLADSLPSSMVPRFIVRLDALPLNANGKVDRMALPEPDANEWRCAYVAPTTEREKLVCAAFERSLGLDRIGMDDSFFALGGDSIRVMRLIALLAERGIKANSHLLLANHTPRALCAALDEAAKEEASSPSLPEDYPLSQTQLGIYAECAARPDELLYHVAGCLRLDASVDPSRLAKALRAAVDAHPQLKGTLGVAEGGMPQMHRNDDAHAEVGLVELADDDAIAEFRASFVKPFDLDGGSLYRLTVAHAPDATRLYYDFHHIVFDGTSLGILLSDASAAYAGKALEPERWSGYEVAQNEDLRRQGPAYQRARDFYAKTFDSLEVESLPLPDALDAPGEGHGEVVVPSGIDVVDLEAFAARNHTTANTVATAAFALTAGTYAGADEALFATVYSGRGDGRTARTVSMLVKTLPVYATWTAETTPRQLFSALQEQLLSSMAHDLYSFAEVSAETGITSDLLFAYQGNTDLGDELCGSAITSEPFALDETGNTLTAQLWPEHGELALHLSFQATRYTPGFAETFGRTYAMVLRGLMEAARVVDVPLADAATLATLDSFNQTEVPYDDTATVLTLFEAAAAANPQNVAALYLDEQLTYAELDAAADALAARISKTGAGADDVVSILIPRGFWMAVAPLAALKAGCAYLPLDATYPPERLSFMVEDAGASVLVTTSELRSRVEGYDGPVVLLDDVPTAGGVDAATREAAAALPKPTAESRFVLLYTSGSTGMPKGVQLTHGNLVCFLVWYRRRLQVDATCRVGAYASFGFDANMMDMYPALTAGAGVVIVPEEMRLDITRMANYLDERKTTHVFLTTQVGRQFALYAHPRHLRYLSVGGEKLVTLDPPEDFELLNMYGPTETTICLTAHGVSSREANVAIGHPLDNVHLYVVDAHGRRVPPGACGELLAAGPHVGIGYLNRPDKTAEVFVRNPFADEEPRADAQGWYPRHMERAYRTGDVVRYRADGEIEFVGRADGQVKIRGFRVELSEVEGVVREFAGIRDATVVALDKSSGGKYVAAYVVSDETVDPAELAAFIRERKPPYMVPEVVMQIDSIPLNQNGKVNKRALPEPVHTVRERTDPATETQRRLFQLAAEALGHRDFGADTDLYEAGLTSINSIQLIALVSREFGVDMRTSDLRANPTVVALEAFLQDHTKSSYESIVTRDPSAACPLTTSQQGVFVDCVANPGSTIYNIPYLLRIGTGIDVDRLVQAICTAISAHPCLDVRLELDDDGEVRQRLAGNTEQFAPTIVDGLDKATLVRPFDLLGERLFRVEIHRADGSTYLFIDAHHIVADGTSLSVLLSDISLAYAGKTPEPEAYGLLDVALAERDQRKSESYLEAEAFYREHYTGCAPTCDLVHDHEQSPARAATLLRTSKAVSPTALEARCAELGVTPNAFVVGAFGAVLARYRFQREATFATIYHGRNEARLARSVGMFVKTLPVRVDASLPAPDYFASVRDLLMGCMDHDVYPFAEVSRTYGIAPTTLLAYQGSSFNVSEFCGEAAELILLDLDTAKEPLCLSVTVDGDAHAYNLQYRADLYDETTAGWLIDNLEIALNQLIEGRDPADLQLLFDEAPRMVDVPAHAGKTFVDLFAETARANPNRVAVRDSESQLTYAELDAASATVAARLRQTGFGPEQYACVLAGRTKEFLVGVIGVMRAGGAYVPMDPDYPTDRLAYMLENSGARHLLLMGEYADLVSGFDGIRMDLAEIANLTAAPATPQELDSWRPSPHNVAYMIYTSGSTGKPKGVMLEHHNLMNFIEHLQAFEKPTPDDLYGEFASFCFDASVHDLFVPLTVGACLYLIPADVRQNAVAVCQTFQREPITISTMPTQMGELVVDQLEGDCALRMAILGGERFKRYYERPYVLVNGYGPTENTVVSTVYVVDKPMENIPIGKSVLNVRSYVVDDQMHRVPVGVPGELVHAGRQIARGYHELPEKTAAAFVDNPFATCEDERRMYHTGDQVRLRGDGNMLYIGRIDNQVKIRGYRVELGEIEGAMLTHDGVNEVAVIAPDLNGTTHIVGYWTGAEVDDATWREFLAPLIPDYMMPSFFVHLDAMPVTSGGKIDRRALPAPALDTTGEDTYVAPTTDLERQLCEIFEKALGLERVGVNDDFFELGGTSLSASKVAVMCFNAKLPIVYADLFERRCVRDLVAVVRENAPDAAAPQESQTAAKRAPTTAQPQSTTATPAAQADDRHKVLSANAPATKRDLAAAPNAYDYTAINELLAANVSEYVDLVADDGLGNVLLTGATGFLGIHVLREYLDRHEGRIWCIVRKGDFQSSERRLTNLLMYYFDRPYTEHFGERIRCIDADISNPADVAALRHIPFRTLVNCAACVKHFAAGDELDRANVQGVQQLVDLCAHGRRRLVHISTISTAGEGLDGSPDPRHCLTEAELFFGQRLNNAYTRSKFLSERVVLQAVADGRIEGKVIRVGNLMSRASDGEFQINSITNGFLRTLRGYAAVGGFPISLMDQEQEFSPIDCVASAVLRLSRVSSRFTVFHACNNHKIQLGDVVYAMREHGFGIRIVDDDYYAQMLANYSAHHEGSDAVGGLIAYSTNNTNRSYFLGYENTFTTRALYRLGWKWPITDDAYLTGAIGKLDALDFFDVE